MIISSLSSVIALFLKISSVVVADESAQNGVTIAELQNAGVTTSTKAAASNRMFSVDVNRGSLSAPWLSSKVKEALVLTHAKRSGVISKPPTRPSVDRNWNSQLSDPMAVKHNVGYVGTVRPLPLALPLVSLSDPIRTTKPTIKAQPVVQDGTAGKSNDSIKKPAPNPSVTLAPKPTSESQEGETTGNITEPPTTTSSEVTSWPGQQMADKEMLTTETVPETTTISKELGACVSSPCFHDGTCHDVSSDKFRCVCGKYKGVQYAGHRCETQLISMAVNHQISPTYGPVAGGTAITLSGSYFNIPLQTLFLAQEGSRYPCDVIKSNETHIVAWTPKVPAGLVGHNLTATVVLAGEVQPDTPDHTALSYQYRTDPLIAELFPLRTLSVGGTSLTVTGRHLDSVAAPVLRVIMTYPGGDGRKENVQPQTNVSHTVFYQACSEGNGTVMICTIPQLDIPEIKERYDSNSTNSTNSSASDQEQAPNKTSSSETSRISRSPTVHEHDTANKTIRSGISLHLGFTLDGLLMYRNLYKHPQLRKFATLAVFRPPTLDIPPDGHHLDYWDGMEITIQGIDLLKGIQPSDYRVDIGQGQCEVTYVSDTILLCTPPQEAPDEGPKDPDDGYAIVVHVGQYLDFRYGTLLYGTSNVAVIVGPIIGGIILVLVIVLVAMLVRNHRRKGKRSKKYRYSPVDRVLPPPISMDEIEQTHLPRENGPDVLFPTFRPDTIVVLDNNTDPKDKSVTGNRDAPPKALNHYGEKPKATASPPEVPQFVFNDTANHDARGDLAWPTKSQTLPLDVAPSFGDSMDYLKVSDNPASKMGSVSSLASSNRSFYDSDDGFSDVDGVYENQPGNTEDQDIEYANSNTFHPRPNISNKSPGKQGKDYNNTHFKNLKPKHAPLPELPHENKKTRHKYVGYDKQDSPKDQWKHRYANYSPRKSPTPDRPSRHDIYSAHESPGALPRHDMFYGTYKSDSEEDEQIYMNSPIKSTGYRGGKRGNRRPRPGHGSKVATLWY